MSFLLDALRKSENQKRLGHVPDIHSTQGLISRQGSRRRFGLIMLLLLPVALILAWYGWKYYNTADGSTVTQAATQAADAANAELPVAQSEPDGPGDSGVLAEIPRIPADQPSTTPGRTPVESYSVPVEAIAEKVLEIPAAEGIRASPRDAIDDADMSVAMVEQGTDDDRYSLPSFADITYWGLPESIREEIPEPRITVLVYAEAPEDRFILMNGERLTEGERTSFGLVLEEIRREGAVFSYRMYRFLTSR